MKAKSVIAFLVFFLGSHIFNPYLLFSQNTRSQMKQLAQRESVLNGILGKLYKASGYRNFSLPRVVLVQSDHLAATYSPLTNQIKFEDRLYLICRSLGKDSTTAMAFVLSHELYHAMENAEKKSGSDLSFLEHSMAGFDQSVSETNADIWGSFLSSLAGFDPTGIYESLFEKIYDAYQVSPLHSDRYPSLEERKKCIQNMRLRVEELILVFELGLILNIESEFTLAENCYKHLLQFYKGPEIFNNLGITQAYQAMSQYGLALDQYYYPFELDVNSKLYDLSKSRGERTAEDIFLRNKLLEQSLHNFYQALDRDQHYLPAYSNIISCLNLMNRPLQAIHFFDSLRLENLWFDGSGPERDNLSLAIGISYALAGREECKSYFRSCMNSGDLRTREFSRSNLMVYENPGNTRASKECPIKDEFTYQSPPTVKKKDPDRTYRFGKNGNIQLDYVRGFDFKRLKLSVLASSGLELIRTRPTTRHKTNLSRIMNSYRDHPEISFIPGREHNFLKCRSGHTLYVLNKKGTVLERILINKI